MAKLSKTFAINLKHLREAKSLSQQALADALGVQRVTINRFEKETSSPSFETLAEIAKFFKVEETDLFQTNEPPSAEHSIVDCYAQVYATLLTPPPELCHAGWVKAGLSGEMAEKVLAALAIKPSEAAKKKSQKG